MILVKVIKYFYPINNNIIKIKKKIIETNCKAYSIRFVLINNRNNKQRISNLINMTI